MADRNGYFQVSVRNDGTFLKIYAPQGNGRFVETGDVVDYLNARGLVFDMLEIDVAVRLHADTEIRLSTEKALKEQEILVVSFDNEDMRAVVRFYPPYEGANIMGKDEILNDLKFRGVVYGIKQNVIDEFVASRQYCTDFVIAEGLPMVPGKDAYIEYLFNTDLSQRPAQNEDGSVDYFHLNNICHCRKGEILARMIPAVKGRTGYTVKGAKLEPQIPRNVLFQHGKNIVKSDDGLMLVSDISGNVTLVDDKVFVSGVLELQDIDTSTGNIDYDGSIVVSGNIASGFSVKATGDIEVKGNVEGALVEAGGQIIIHHGINGMSRGVIRAGSNIISKYIENATVDAGGYVETDCIIHSNVSAKDHVVVQGKKGFITGGAVRAGAYIEAKTLGSTMGVDTLLEVGTDPVQKQKHLDLQKEIADCRREIARLDPVIRAVGERLGKGEKFSIDQMKQAKALSTVLAQRKEILKEDLVQVAKLEMEFDKATDAVVKVTGEAFPGTRIVVSESTLILKTAYHYCRFIKENSDVIMKAL